MSKFSSCYQAVPIHHHFPVAILCTLLHRENTLFEVWYLQELSTLNLGILRLNQNVWMLGKIPMVENSNNMVTFFHHRQIQLLYRQLQNQSLHSNLLEILTILHLVSVQFDFVIVLDGFSRAK